jgi:hypothetical protein
MIITERISFTEKSSFPTISINHWVVIFPSVLIKITSAFEIGMTSRTQSEFLYRIEEGTHDVEQTLSRYNFNCEKICDDSIKKNSLMWNGMVWRILEIEDRDFSSQFRLWIIGNIQGFHQYIAILIWIINTAMN